MSGGEAIPEGVTALDLAPAELAAIASGTGWSVDRLVPYEDEPEAYAVVLRRGC